MAKRFEVGVRITGNSKSIEKAASRSSSALRRLGETMRKNLVVSAASLALALRGLLGIFKSVTEAAGVQQQAVNDLDAALRPLGASAAGVSERLQEQAAALQKVTTAGDETIIKGQALIATFTQNEEEIKRSTEAALNLSAAIGVDLNAAFLLMGKAASGETSTLSRYGIILEEGIPKAEQFAAVLALIEDKMGGRAQAAAKTFTGVVAQIGNAFGDLEEKAGLALIENEKVTEQLGRLKRLLEEEGTIESVAKLAENIVTIGTGAATTAAAITDMILIAERVKAAFSESTGEIVVATLGLDKLAESVKTNVSPAFNEFLDSLGRSFEEQEKLSKGAAGITSKYAQWREVVESLNAALKDEAVDLLNTGDAADELEGHFKDATEAAVGLGNALGVVTSVELELEIVKINEALAESTSKLDENSAEYIRLEEIASEKIESIQARIVNLRDGLGDLKVSTEEGADAWVDYGSSVGVARAEAGQLLTQLRTLRVEVETPLRGDFARQAQARRSRGQASPNAFGGSSYFATIGGGTFTYFTPVPAARTQPNGRLVVG